MNIKQAKQQIVNTVKAYLTRDEYGRSAIPQNKQRPLFLMGPPGIGKTEIMAQTAEELGIGLLSYSMTHHTRQSALGLPIIKHKTYFGKEYDISEYTMSEIIADIYETMTASGLENGILFLDEINCVSETLTPVMLQFLQYKVFGGHKIPEGWIVVTAGNPPEYNNSVREFDIVTWDRLKRIDIEPDFKAWKEYAYSVGMHPAVLTYLEIKPENFYKTETTADGKSFVTARGWDDLGRMLQMYEHHGMAADEELISQYIQNKTIASDFAVYYELYCKYKNNCRISDILSGNISEDMLKRAQAAKFDERLSLLGLMLETVGGEAKTVLSEDADLLKIRDTLIRFKNECAEEDADKLFAGYISETEQTRQRLKAANNLSRSRDDSLLTQAKLLKKYRAAAAAKDAFAAVKAEFEKDVDAHKTNITQTKLHFSNMFDFCERAFGSGNEILILVTELAAAPHTARFISAYGCEEYHKHDKALMFYERRLEISDEIKDFEKEFSDI